jgi:hypothetical protein
LTDELVLDQRQMRRYFTRKVGFTAARPQRVAQSQDQAAKR